MVTAIIVNYHSHLLTVRAAASVVADCPDAQVIVVDNSTDAVEARALQAALPLQATCLIAPENLGFGKACNLGFGMARHDWVLLLNPDALVLPGCIRNLRDFLEQTPHAGAAAPLTYWDTEQNWLLPPAQLPTPVTELGLTFAMCQSWLGNRISQGFRQWAFSCLHSQTPVVQKMLSGGVVLLRNSAVEAAGGLFDPDFFMYYEDTDLCMRLQRTGFHLYLVPAAKAIHAWEAAPNKFSLSTASRLLYFQKQFPGSVLFALLQRLKQSGFTARLPISHDLGVRQASPHFPVLPELQSAWVLEVSPHPLLVPALYYCGQGEQCLISDQVWPLLGAGDYWARLAGPAGEGAVLFRWQIK